MMDKMLGNKKKFGRCKVQGHSQCEVTQEIQSMPVSKTTENAEWKKEAESELGIAPCNSSQGAWVALAGR